ncbi:MAG: hypothetical protein COW85_12000 [Ignavibacteria bacterium CG22_combo_CG10-13_8_21_14_all_37_15]|nr:MAG: hypothetical protein COW85_12000 [Ignavibacteria bacterium CG22_combo_CG10-13_8_21_14_all_37_15]
MAKMDKKRELKAAKKTSPTKIKLKAAEEVSEFAENIINTLREPLLVLDKDLRVVKASRSFFDFFEVSSDETIGNLIYDLGNHQWNIPKLRELLETILPEKATFDNYEVEHDFSTIGKRIMLLNARQIERAFGKEKIILLAIEDITERKEIETGLEKTRKELAVIKKSADELGEFAENIINTVREPLLVLDKDLRVVKASRSFYDFFKVSSDETIGKLIYDLGNHQWDIPKLRELLETILPEKATFDNYEVEHDFSTIGKRIMLLNARQIERAFGKEKIILLAIEDITGRKEIETGLEKTRKELVVIKKSADEVSEFAENLINTIREPLIALDKDLRVVKASRSFYDFFKVNSDETIGTLIYDLGNHQWNIPKLRELLETILPEKATFDNYEVKHDFSTIGKRIMLLNARQIERAFGKEKIILLAIEDITERKKIETGLENTRKELVVIKKSADEVSEFAENLINTVREPLLALDQDLRVVKASRSFYDFFKVNSDETIGTLIYDLGNHQWNIPKLRELLETILPEKTTFDNYEVKHDFSTIGKRIMLLNARKIQRGTGKEQIILLAIEDITERKKNENELSKAKAEAERANVAKSEFLSRMSHELRTPMNSILGFAQLMDMKEPDPAHKEGVNQILKSGKHLLDLINEVLDMARIESGKLTVSPEPVEIFGVILETIDIVRHLAEEHQITLESDVSTDKKLFIRADHQRLKQVLLNLINNAVKYNRQGGSVKVQCSGRREVGGSLSAVQGQQKTEEGKKDNVIRISVIDTGQGIAQEHLEKLFNPFERIGAERTETEGTGLGLAISKKLIDAMNGKIGVESEVGKGSNFWIELPQTESPQVYYERTREIIKPETAIKQNSGTILYIEDNLSNIQLVEQILEAYRPSIKLMTNMYGRNAVQFAIDYKPDLILLDLNLPDIHGSIALKLLQEEPRTAETPVIILSADAVTKQIEQLIEAGAKDYLIKPIDVVQFLKVVDKFLSKEN